MVDLYVQQSHLVNQRKANDEKIRKYIEGDRYRPINYDDIKDDEYNGRNGAFSLSNDFNESEDTITDPPSLAAYAG